MIHGRLLRAKFGTGGVKEYMEGETSATLTVTRQYVSGAKDRGTLNKETKRGWKMDVQLLMTEEELQSLYTAMSNGTSADVEFSGKWVQGRKQHTMRLSGKAMVQRVSFAGQGKGIVRLSVSLVGNGKPEMAMDENTSSTSGSAGGSTGDTD